MPASSRSDPLTADVVIEAALEVTRQVGLDRLTMRAVATELGVSPMAIYYHVPDKEHLVEGVLGHVAAQQEPLVLGDDGWEAALRRYLMSLWEVQARFPGVSAHLIERPMFGTTPQAQASGVQFFLDAGFPERTAQLAWSFALTYIHGRLSVDARLHGPAGRPARFAGLRSRDHVEFGVNAVVAALSLILAEVTVASSQVEQP